MSKENPEKDRYQDDKPVIFIDIENCTNFQLSGEADDYAGICIACRENVNYPIIEQVDGLPQSVLYTFSEPGKDKADNLLLEMVKNTIAMKSHNYLILQTNDLKLRSRFQRLCDKAMLRYKCIPFKFYGDYVGLFINELSKQKQKYRPDNLFDLTLFLQNVFDDLEVYHLSPSAMRRKMESEGLIEIRNNYVTYKF